jgi:hypothetical protein
MENIDYFSGFEGEKEVSIWYTSSGRRHWRIHLWYGYLHEITEAIPPNTKGAWEGLTLIFHANEDFMEGDAVEIKDLPLVIRQLSTINDVSISEPTAKLKNELLRCLQSIGDGGHVFIQED